MKNNTLFGEDDGLLIPDDLGSWTEDKFDLIRNYCQIFSTSMKNKWTRVYIDLYAGSGLCRIKGRKQPLLGSPLIALSVDAPFDRYIFCESDANRFAALEKRIRTNYSNHTVNMIPGKFEENIHEICSKIPQNSLALCFVDPFNCDFNFEDIRKISKSARVDFICLLALQMDAKRNEQHYLQPDSKIDRMIGNPTWRVRWKNRVNHNEDFAKFLANEFANSMTEIGYKKTQLHEMKTVKMHDKKVPLYYLALFAKHEIAFDFWKKALKSSTPQRDLFD